MQTRSGRVIAPKSEPAPAPAPVHEPYVVQVSTLTRVGKVQIWCSPFIKLSDLMDKIHVYTGVSPHLQRLLFQGRQFWAQDFPKTLVELGKPEHILLVQRMLSCVCCPR